MPRRTEDSELSKWLGIIVIGFIFLCFILFIISSLSKERYSPYRYNTGCPNAVRWEYHKEYDAEDYYKKYPYIYPTPTNYVKAWYAGTRSYNKFLAEQRKKMKEEYRGMC